MNTTTETHTLRGVVCTALGGVCWGFSGTCGQYLFSTWDFSPTYLTCVRLLAAGLIMTTLAAFKNREQLLGVWKNRRDAVELVCFGCLGLMPCSFAYMTAISYSNAATTTVLQNLSLVFIMLIACAAARRRPTRVELLSLLLAAFGTWVLATGGNPGHMVLSPKGLLWGLITAGGVTVYTVLPRNLLLHWGRDVVIGCGTLIGGVILNLATRSWTFSPQLPLRGWLAVLAVIFLGTVMSLSLFMQGVADIGPVRTSMLSTTEPMSAAVFSALWLGTRFSPADLVGFACILATIFLLSKSE